MQNLNSEWTYGSSIRVWRVDDLVECKRPGHPPGNVDSLRRKWPKQLTNSLQFMNRLRSFNFKAIRGAVGKLPPAQMRIDRREIRDAVYFCRGGDACEFAGDRKASGGSM